MRPITFVLQFLTTFCLAFAYAGATETKGTYTLIEQPAASAQQVSVGFYPISVYTLDASSNTYYVDAYVWLRWKGDIDPISTLEFTNMVEEWGALKEPLLEKPEVLSDGSKYQIERIEGRFVQPFSLTAYPLDHQKLTIRIEDTKHGSDQLAYVIDKVDSGIGDRLRVAGWDLDGWSAQTYLHNYGTHFGSSGDESSASTFSTVEFNLHISRPANYFVFKILFPLVMILCAVWSVLLIDPKRIEVRTALPATALMTTVFLQQAYSSNLPEVGYLVLLDKIYVVAYALIVLTLLRAVIKARGIDALQKPQIAAIRRRDHQILAAQIFVFALSTALFVLLR